jgi:hypothetical protein
MTSTTASADLVDVIAEPGESLARQVQRAFTRWLKTTPTPGVDAQSQGITTLANPPSWLKSALADVARTAALPANWDSYGSPPLSETARQNAVQLLASIEYEDFPAPCIVPISGGGLQIEWQYNRRELELEIVAGSPEVLFLKVHEDDSAEEGAFSITDRSTLQALLDWLFVG